MSHSKGTTNYNLPLFTKDDRPAWLTDFNSAMLEVDAVMKRTSDAARPDLLEAAQQEAAAALDKATDAQTKANGALQKSGGTMTGNLILNAAPTSNLQAATKKYVDDAIANVPTPTGGITQEQADARYVQLAGGTMTGVLTLSGAPTSDLQASTKKYVDDQIKLNITDVINASY